MHSLQQTTYGDYRIGAQLPLTAGQTEQLIALFEAPTLPTESALGGRTSVVTGEIAGIGELVVKHYHRGGLLSRFNKRTYLKAGKPRCRIEYEMLDLVRRNGVNAPQPIAFALRGRLFYRCWLATRRIRSHRTLAELSRTDLARSLASIDSVADQIERLIQSGIRHVDLHPGNVIIDPENIVYFIDFDKAGLSRLSKTSLRNHYLERWKRAVSIFPSPPPVCSKAPAPAGA